MSKGYRIAFCSIPFLLLFFFGGTVSAATIVSDDITTSTEWTQDEDPYVVSTPVAIQSGVTLTIDPGVVVKFDHGASFGVYGTIAAMGTDANPVTFTSLADAGAGDTNGDGADSMPQPGDWDGITFLGDGTQTLSHVHIDYANTALSAYAGSFAIDHMTCSYVGHCLEFTGGNATVDALSVDHPTGEIIGLLGGSTMTLHGATFTQLDDVHAPDLVSSYLGSTLSISNLLVESVPAIAEGITTFVNGSLSLDHATFTNLLTTTTDAMSSFSGSTLTVSNTTITGNAVGNGVEVYDGGTLNFSQGNIAHFLSGVATYNSDGGTPSTLSLDHTIISNNDTGIEVDGTPTLTTDTLSVHDNPSGGVVYNHDDGKTIATPNVWWGDPSGPYNATTNPDGLGDSVSNDVVVDPILTADPFDEDETPATYYAAITGLSQGYAALRDTPSLEATLIKTLPVDYIVAVVSKTNDDGTDAVADGYRWYKIEDPTDGTEGWMIAGSDSSETPTYLPYDEAAQDAGAAVAAAMLDTRAKRQPVIEEAVDHYFGNTDAAPSLYSSDDTIGNEISDLTAAGFPEALVLAIIAQESGGVKFDNEFVTPDYGHGVMQITPNYYSHEQNQHYNENTSYPLGEYSKVKDSICDSYKSDAYRKCYQNVTDKQNKLNKPYDFYSHDPSNQKYKQYSNTKQSIYANIKDGLGVLVEKYKNAKNSSCKKGTYSVDGETFTCSDLQKIKTVWAYNGIDLTDSNNYLQLISQKLANLSAYFPGYSYDDSDHLIEKLAIANNHRKEIKVHSPVDLQVTDMTTHETTGVLPDGAVVEGIDNSIYDPDSQSALILFPTDDYKYTLVGTANSTYGFEVSNGTDGETETVFSANDIPVQDGAVHTYTLDEPVLEDGGDGATLTIDNDADGAPDETIQSGPVLQDITPPAIDLSSLADTYVLGQKITFAPIVTDTLSKKKNITLTATFDGAPLPIVKKKIILPLIGDHLLSLTATDEAGNQSTATKQLHINYVFNGIHFTPNSESSTYSKGKKVKVHFTLKGKNKVAVPDDHPGIDVVRESDSFHARINPDPMDANGLCDASENCFSKTDNNYSFTLDTSLLDSGWWDIVITTGDGTTHTAPLLIQ